MNLAEEARATGLTMRRQRGSSLADPNITPLTSYRVSPWLRRVAARSFAGPSYSYRDFPGTTARQLYIILEPEGQHTSMGAVIDVVKQRLNGLLELSPDWNGANAPEIAGKAVETAAMLIFQILDDEVSLSPQFFPLPNGGLQFEWHVGGRSVEIEVDPDGSAFAVADSETDESALIEEDVDEHTLARVHTFLTEAVKRAL